jgi:hypothetical protein
MMTVAINNYPCNSKVSGVLRKKMLWLCIASLVAVCLLPYDAGAVECPGFCAQCRSDALFVCGAGCVQQYSCSLSECSCSFTCAMGSCRSGGIPAEGLLRDSIGSAIGALQNTSRTHSTPRASFRVTAAPGIHVSVADIQIGNDSGREVSQMSYTISNGTDFSLRTVRILIVFFSDLGKPLGAESISEALTLAPRQQQVLQATLRHYVGNGQHVAIAITDFETTAQSWHGDHAEIIKAMRQP